MMTKTNEMSFKPAHKGGVEYWSLPTYLERFLGWFKTEVYLPLKCPGCIPFNYIQLILLPLSIPFILILSIKRWDI